MYDTQHNTLECLKDEMMNIVFVNTSRSHVTGLF